MATLHFLNAIMYLQGSGTEAIEISETNDISIDIDFDEDPDPAFGDVWESKLKGLLRFSGSMAGNYDTAQAGNALWHAVITSGQSAHRKWYMYPTRATTTSYYYGNIFPKLSIRGGTGGKGAFSGAFSSAGQLAING